jgi:hypothetical protein
MHKGVGEKRRFLPTETAPNANREKVVERDTKQSEADVFDDELSRKAIFPKKYHVSHKSPQIAKDAAANRDPLSSSRDALFIFLLVGTHTTFALFPPRQREIALWAPVVWLMVC